MTAIDVAKIFDRADDLWLVTSYFNPVGYRSRPHNYEIFRDRIARSKLNLLTMMRTRLPKMRRWLESSHPRSEPTIDLRFGAILPVYNQEAYMPTLFESFRRTLSALLHCSHNDRCDNKPA